MSVRHGNEALSIVSVSTKFLHVLKIHDRRTMNAQENVGVQLGLEIGHRITEHMALFAGAYSHIIFFRADPANVRNGQKQNTAFGTKHEAVAVSLPFRRSNCPIRTPSLALFAGMPQRDP